MPVSIGTTTVTALFLGTTSITSAYLGATQVFGGSFTPLDLFSGGAQGIWLDPSDLSTMFSDRAGTTAVTTPGTVVGLRLDKSKGLVLGSELVTNGDFAAGSTGYVEVLGGTISYASQTMLATATTGNTGVYRDVTVVANKSYQVAWRQVSGTNIRMNIYDGAGFGTTLFTNGAGDTIVGNRVTVLRPSSTTLRIYAHTPTGSTAEFDNISVRELPGNHAVAPTDAARPVYGIEPKGGRRNLLTWSEDFGNAAWTKTGASASGQEVRETTANSGHLIFQPASFTGSHAFSVELQAVGRDLLTIWMGTSSGTFAFQYTFSTNTISSVGSALSGVTSSVLTGGWVRLTGAVLTPNRFQVSTGAPGATYVGDPATGFNIRNAQLELGSTATAYQRVTTAYDVTESGVATTHYVQYDGSDDSMSTAAIDFTATDKMSVFAGVRKLSDAATGILYESIAGPGNNSVSLFAPDTTTSYIMQSRGTNIAKASATGFSAPVSSIVTGLADVSGDLVSIRIDGVLRQTTTGDQGTGNFASGVSWFGRRAGSSLPFNGRDYGIIIVGKAASAGEITDTETWLAAKTAQVTL